MTRNWSKIKTVPTTTAAFSLDITIPVQYLYTLNYCHASLALLLPWRGPWIYLTLL